MRFTVYNKVYQKWILTYMLIIMILIQCSIITMFSSQTAQVSKTLSQAVMDKLEFIFESVSGNQAEADGDFLTLHYVIRKTAHFYNFFLLGILLYASVCVVHGDFKGYLFPVVLGLSVAVFDESHQYFVPGRSAEIADVLIDFSGVLLGICFLRVLYEFILRKEFRV